MSNQKLVNAFGAISLEDTQVSNQELLQAILIEMRMMNEHFARMRNEVIEPDELDVEDYVI